MYQPESSRCYQVLVIHYDALRDTTHNEEIDRQGWVEFTGDYFRNDYGEDDFPMGDGACNSEGMTFDDDDSSSDDSDADTERVWEPHRTPAEPELDEEIDDEDESAQQRLGEIIVERRAAQARLQYRPARIVKFNDVVPYARAGKAYRHLAADVSEQGSAAYTQFTRDLQTRSGSEGRYAPFRSKLDWEVACWAKTRGAGSNALDDLLKIDGIVQMLGLSYRNARELNALIDKQIPSRRPLFRRREIVVGGTQVDLYSRDTMECIRALLSAPEFADGLILQPERHFADEEERIQVYHDMHTGEWWWASQWAIEQQEPGGTVIPVIISLDKTQITLFHTKTAYPVYLTIANIPKDIRKKPLRQAQVLLAYLPTSRLQHISSNASHRRMLQNLVHACMRFIFCDMGRHGGPGVLMTDGNGIERRCHPILATVAIDYQEQVQVSSIISGDCPKCICRKHELGEHWEESHTRRDLDEVLDIMDILDSDDLSQYSRVCKAHRIKPIQHPFWIDLPYCDVFNAVTPDILHQLHQGVIKHLIEWLTVILGEKKLDARCRRIPPNHSIRVFHMDLSILNRVSGTEHSQICQFLLGLLAGFQLGSNRATQQLVRATRAILDFVYIAQYPIHTLQTLELLDDALRRFHENKQVFIDEGARVDFNFIKLHSMVHYTSSIKSHGTTDNYNTQFTERLHIDFAKDAYAATNHKDELPQMTRWLERKEKVCDLKKNIDWRTQQFALAPPWTSTKLLPDLEISTAKNPTKTCNFKVLADSYGVHQFDRALARYAVSLKYPNMCQRELEQKARDELIIVRLVSVFERIKFRNEMDDDRPVVDSIHARARKLDKQGRDVPGRFDTALVRIREGTDIQSFRIAQARAIFSLNDRALSQLFMDDEHVHLRALVPRRLAYVEWFSKFSPQPDINFRMYKVSCSLTPDSSRESSIIPVADFHRSAHLIPQFGKVAPAHWTSSNVLEECTDFYLNDFRDRSTHFSMF
ncbi:hypothetical protein ACEPAF_43 [Sanghuangporus sanghuang]